MNAKRAKAPAGNSRIAKLPNPTTQNVRATPVPLGDQQKLLQVFQASFADLLGSTEAQTQLESKLQHVKTHLYNRDFDQAFSDADCLRAYAARWSPTRALAYQDLLIALDDQYAVSLSSGGTKVLSLGGGGGAELASLYACVNRPGRRESDQTDDKHEPLQVILIDIANWAAVLGDLYHTCSRVYQWPRISPNCVFQSSQQNLLDPNAFAVGELAEGVSSARLITMFFTLNELFNDSLPRAQTMLLNLSRHVGSGALLVVVDSAGSYSTVGLGARDSFEGSNENRKVSKEAKVRKYPMSWLLDHVLLKLAAEITPGKTSPWSKLDGCDSQWFRLSSELRYPITLEDMRYQYHVFRHV